MVAIAPPPISPTPSSGILLRGISWETYQALVRELESQPSKRLTYDNGLLEILMPLPPHEKNKKYLARLVEIISETLDIEICSLGSCTWSRKDLAKGVEPDECYYIQNEAVIRALANGEYQEIPASIALPIVTPAVLQTWLTQSTTMGETSWAKAIRRWVQETMDCH